LAGYLALAAFLQHGQGHVRLVLHEAGVPGPRIAALTLARLCAFILPGAVVGGATAYAAGWSRALPEMLLATLAFPAVVLMLIAGAAMLTGPSAGQGEKAP
jgi:hypothetical protein